MAAAAVKLPLNLRKQERDLAPKKDATLAEMSEKFGSPIKFEHNLDTLYASVVGNQYADKMVECIYESYLEAFQGFFRSLNEYIDPDGDVKKELLRHWTTGKITMVVEPNKDFKYKEDTPLTCTGQYGSGGWRIVNGNLECWTRKDDFWYNLPAISDCSWLDLLKNAPPVAGQLPMDMRLAIARAEKSPECKERGIEKFKELTGKKIVWDLTADGLEYLKNPNYKDLNGGYNPEYATGYMEAFVRMLSDKFGDDMVKEALMEKLSNNPVKFSVKLVKDTAAMDKIPNSVGDQYSRLQLQDGNVTVYHSAYNGYSNIDYLSNHDVTTML